MNRLYECYQKHFLSWSDITIIYGSPGCTNLLVGGSKICTRKDVFLEPGTFFYYVGSLLVFLTQPVVGNTQFIGTFFINTIYQRKQILDS